MGLAERQTSAFSRDTQAKYITARGDTAPARPSAQFYGFDAQLTIC